MSRPDAEDHRHTVAGPAEATLPLLDAVAPLLAAGQKQSARALAQAALQAAGDGQGCEEAHLACSVVALAEGYNELAAWHWARVESPVLRRAAWPHGLRMAWQDCEEHVSDAETMPWPDGAAGAALLREAWALGRHRDTAAALAKQEHAQTRHAKAWLDALGGVLCRIEVPGVSACANGAPPMVLVLPPFPLDGLDFTGRTVRAPRWAAACAAAAAEASPSLAARWARWWRERSGAVEALALVPVDAMSCGALDRGRRALIVDAVLTRSSEPHWTAVLSSLESVVVLGLKVHDPGALTDSLVHALRCHQPIGVRDTTSRLLLQEAGISAGEFGVTPEPARAGAAGLWGATEPLPLPASWVEDWRLPGIAALPLPPATRLAPPAAGNVPAPPGDVVHLACAADAAMAPMVPVLVQSSLDHLSLPLHVHVLTRGLAPATVEAWQRLFAGRAHIEAHACDDWHYGDAPHLLAHTSVSTLDRLRLPELLPTLPRVLYLDLDLVVLGDLAPLWSLDLRGYALAAKPSTSPGTRYGVQMIYQALGALPPEQARARRLELHACGPMCFPAFNAGVLLLDLDRLRRDGAVPRLLDFVHRFAMNDQDALNAWVRGDYLRLGTEWNAAPRQDPTANARIVHFVGPVKPWHELYTARREAFLAVQARVQAQARAMRLGGLD